jgi:hypothetical protein
MRWTWPFSGRAGNGQHKNGNGSDVDGARPDFLCIGLHKAGTTWLYQQLDSHPDFWMPPIKELHYFDQLSRVQRKSPPRCRDDRDRRFLESLTSLTAEPRMDFENYAQLFAPKGSLLSGDISPNYSTLGSGVIRQVVEYFPNLKVIFLARDPVERLWSHLSMEVHYHQIEPFARAIPRRSIGICSAEGCSYARIRVPSSRDGNVMFTQIDFALISLMTYKEIQLNCGVRSSIS